MPMTAAWDRPWYETPNIHPCTIRDFFALCAEQGYTVERWLAVDDAGRRTGRLGGWVRLCRGRSGPADGADSRADDHGQAEVDEAHHVN